MCDPFTIDFDGDPEEVFNRIKEEITTAGGTVNGNSSQGTFSIGVPLGTVRGMYSINGQQIAITITHKPLLISCNTIEDELRKRFEGL